MILSVGKRSAANLHIGPTPKKLSCSFDGTGCWPRFETIPKYQCSILLCCL